MAATSSSRRSWQWWATTTTAALLLAAGCGSNDDHTSVSGAPDTETTTPATDASDSSSSTTDQADAGAAAQDQLSVVNEPSETVDPAVRWTPLLAPPGTCAHQLDAAAPVDELARAATCLVDHARRESGLLVLPRASALDDSASAKVRLLARCDVFGHTPCDTAVRRTFLQAGYGVSCARWRVGENLGVGGGAGGTPRAIVLGWLRSSGHRENLLDPSWDAQGMAVLRLAQWTPMVDGSRKQFDDALVYASHFGSTSGC
ncbi:MAG: CAP domain-containing protein [Thermoleophilia bacterium]|nr:CAP domain-containing protein [Thermoleophilia bacterium]